MLKQMGKIAWKRWKGATNRVDDITSIVVNIPAFLKKKDQPLTPPVASATKHRKLLRKSASSATSADYDSLTDVSMPPTSPTSNIDC